MQHPAFKTLPGSLFFLGIFLLTGQVLAWCPSGLLQLPAGIVLMDGLFQGFLLSLLAFFLWFFVLFAPFSGEGKNGQRLLGRFVLLLIALLVWMGLTLLLEYLFLGKQVFIKLFAALPVRSFSGFLLLWQLARWYDERKTNYEQDEQETDDFEPCPQVVSAEAKERAIDHVSVKNGQKIAVINVPDILFLQADGDYVLIHTREGRFLKEQTMKYFEEHLPSDRFVRIHRSCLVNIGFVTRIELYEKQNYRIILSTGQQLKASLTGYRLLKQVLQL